MHRRTAMLASVSLLGIVPTAVYGDDTADAQLKTVQGRWGRTVKNGPRIITLVKEHVGNCTVLTATDENNAVLYAHTAEFKVERQGKVSLFTFFNLRVTDGPNAGNEEKGPTTYLYRITNGKFIEVRGVVDGDNGDPAMIVWDRLPDVPKSAAI